MDVVDFLAIASIAVDCALLFSHHRNSWKMYQWCYIVCLTSNTSVSSVKLQNVLSFRASL